MKKPKIRFKIRNNWRYRYNVIQIIPEITVHKLSWKDKYNTPRVETIPQLGISWLGFNFSFYYGDDEEWERHLWDKKYRKEFGEYPWKTIELNEN